MEGLHFDAEAHTYTLDGARVPSVTEILSDLSAREYRFVDRATMERTAWFGQAVHKVIELDIRGTLDVDSLDAALVPYLEKWREFRAHSGFVPLMSEQQVASRRYRYGGTLDLAGELNGRRCIVDAKRCAGVPRTAGPQTAGYLLAVNEMHPDFAPNGCDRYALHLTPSETRGWTLVPFRDPNDSRVFLSALTLHNWSKH